MIRMASHELFDFMQQTSDELEAEYSRIARRAREDPGTAGDEGEENWRALLQHWLPPEYQVVTKGRIIGIGGDASPQVDVLVLHPAYPAGLIGKKLYVAGGVLAAFECKTTLRKSHIEAAVRTARAITQLLPRRLGTSYRELHRPVVYGLLAHSHAWRGEGSRPADNVTTALLEADTEIIEHPNQMLDFVCVSDLGTWTASKSTFVGTLEVVDEQWQWRWYEQASVVTAYLLHSASRNVVPLRPFTNVGAMVADLWVRIGYEHPTVRPLAEYFSAVGLSGDAIGPSRVWPLTPTCSKPVRDRLLSKEAPFSIERWSEWREAWM